MDQSNQSQPHLPHVFFRPWVGANYGEKNQWGVSIMVLGESHWCTDAEAVNPNFTIELMQEVVRDGWRYPFWSRIATLFLGRAPTDDEYRSFWDSALFYNYVQQSVGHAARTRPTHVMWTAGADPFQELIAHYQPEFILATGKELWDNLPNTGHSGPPIKLEGDGSKESWLYSHPSGSSLAFGIRHPQSWGWKYQDWTAWVHAALQAARAQKQAACHGPEQHARSAQ